MNKRLNNWLNIRLNGLLNGWRRKWLRGWRRKGLWKSLRDRLRGGLEAAGGEPRRVDGLQSHHPCRAGRPRCPARHRRFLHDAIRLGSEPGSSGRRAAGACARAIRGTRSCVKVSSARLPWKFTMTVARRQPPRRRSFERLELDAPGGGGGSGRRLPRLGGPVDSWPKKLEDLLPRALLPERSDNVREPRALRADPGREKPIVSYRPSPAPRLPSQAFSRSKPPCPIVASKLSL